MCTTPFDDACFFTYPAAYDPSIYNLLRWVYSSSGYASGYDRIADFSPCIPDGYTPICNEKMYQTPVGGEPIYKPGAVYNLQDFLLPAGVSTSFTFDKSKF